MSLPGEILPLRTGEEVRRQEEIGALGRVAWAGIDLLVDVVATVASVLVQRHSTSAHPLDTVTRPSSLHEPLSSYPASWGSTRRT